MDLQLYGKDKRNNNTAYILTTFLDLLRNSAVE